MEIKKEIHQYSYQIKICTNEKEIKLLKEASTLIEEITMKCKSFDNDDNCCDEVSIDYETYKILTNICYNLRYLI